MKRLLFLIGLVLISNSAFSQIVIEASDMPVSGDVFTRSYANPISLSAYSVLSDTGGNHAWNFNDLISITQVTDTFLSAAQISLVYALTLPSGSFGFKVADSIPLVENFLPVSVQSIYSFYQLKNNPDKFLSVALGISVDNFPIPAIYSTPDVVYFLPLIYGDVNYAPYKTGFELPNTLGFIEKGSRTTKVDGWGTIVTPYITTPTNCLRLRSEKDEVDSLIIDSLTIPIPDTTVEYKWMVKNVHYPVLQITTNRIFGAEVISSIEYLNAKSNLGVVNTRAVITTLKAYPNPATDGYVTIDVPKDWQNFNVTLFDMQGREVATFANNPRLDLAALAKGNYIARVISGNKTGYVRITK